MNEYELKNASINIPYNDFNEIIKELNDLRELEKFGFRYIYGTSWYNGKFRINKNTRKIRIITNGSPYEIDAIYDLIKAGLVEKCGDE